MVKFLGWICIKLIIVYSEILSKYTFIYKLYFNVIQVFTLKLCKYNLLSQFTLYMSSTYFIYFLVFSSNFPKCLLTEGTHWKWLSFNKVYWPKILGEKDICINISICKHENIMINLIHKLISIFFPVARKDLGPHTCWVS